MVAEELVSGEGGRLETILGALRESADKIIRYFAKTAIFYSVLIIFMGLSLYVASEAKDRGFYIGVLILLGLGMLGMWISPLRGLRAFKVSAGGFFNLGHLALRDGLAELEDAGRWGGAEERLRRAEEVLEHQAAAEKEERAWPNRALSLVVITIIDLLIWLVWKNGVMALVNQGIAMVVSQVHISLAPNASLKAWKALRGE